MDLSLIYWDHSYNTVLLVNFAIIIGLFISLRIFSGVIAHINASDELLKKDNPAFGLSLAGMTFAVSILLSGLVYGEIEINIYNSAISVGLYGLIGIILMALTRIIFDKIALPHISLRDEISKGNMAVAIADTANVLAAAIIIRAVMVWITDNTVEAIGVLLAIYAISQVILTVTTLIGLKIFKLCFKGRSVEQELHNNNTALAVTFAGAKIMTAMAITLSSDLVVYGFDNLVPALLSWALVSIIFIIVLKIVSFIALRIILFKVNIWHEVLEQKNVAIGAFIAVIYISMGILLSEF